MKLRWKMALVVVIFGGSAIVAANALVYDFLVRKGRQTVKQQASQTARIISTAVLGTMINTGDYRKIGDVIAKLRSIEGFEFRMVRNKHVIKQFGVRRGETPKGPLETQALMSGKVIETMDTPSSMKIIFPFITDARCAKCHLDMEGKPVRPGMVNGVAVIRFDLSEQQHATKLLLVKILFLTSSLIIVFFTLFFLAVNEIVTKPIKQIAGAVTAFRKERFDVELPDYTTTEIRIMADEVKATGVKLADRKRERETQISAERERGREVENLIRSRAGDLGIEKDVDISEFIGRLSRVVDEAEQKRLVEIASGYIEDEHSALVLPSDPDLVPAVSAYLSSMVRHKLTPVKIGTMELVIDEALANAIYHGNLEVPSRLKTDDFDSFYQLAAERKNEAPYVSRKIRAVYDFNSIRLAVTIKDEGKGFDWKALTDETMPEAERPHGRGLIIMRALASSLEFNDAGNQITITFDFNQRPDHAPTPSQATGPANSIA